MTLAFCIISYNNEVNRSLIVCHSTHIDVIWVFLSNLDSQWSLFFKHVNCMESFWLPFLL